MSSPKIRALLEAFSKEMQEAIRVGAIESVRRALEASGPAPTKKKPTVPAKKKSKPAPTAPTKTDARVEQLPRYGRVSLHVDAPLPLPPREAARKGTRRQRMAPIGSEYEDERKEARRRKKAAIAAAVLATAEAAPVDPRGAGYVRRRRAAH